MRAKLLGSPDQPCPVPLNMSRKRVWIGVVRARIYAFGLCLHVMLSSVTTGLCSCTQIDVPKGMESIVRQCNVFGVKKA